MSGRKLLTPKQVKKIGEFINQDFDDLQDATEQIIDLILDEYSQRAQYVVVASRKPRNPEDEILNISVGPFATYGVAEKAGESLFYSATSGETYKWFVMPLHYGTPAEWHTKRKQIKMQHETEEAEKKAKEEYAAWQTLLSERARQTQEQWYAKYGRSEVHSGDIERG